MIDPIADMLTRIRNASGALLPVAELPHSRLKESLAQILKKEGYIADFAVEGKTPKTPKTLKLRLKYQGKKAVIEGLRRVSKPGLRCYVGALDIPRVRGGLGTAIVSTSQGVMSGTEARKQNLGGELICMVW
jgi:small subunit ribosomal protein S8